MTLLLENIKISRPGFLLKSYKNGNKRTLDKVMKKLDLN